VCLCIGAELNARTLLLISLVTGPSPLPDGRLFVLTRHVFVRIQVCKQESFFVLVPPLHALLGHDREPESVVGSAEHGEYPVEDEDQERHPVEVDRQV